MALIDAERRNVVAAIGAAIVGMVALVVAAGLYFVFRERSESPEGAAPAFPEAAPRSPAAFVREREEGSRVFPAPLPTLPREQIRLFQVWDRPVAAASFVTGGAPWGVRFVERESGDVYEAGPSRLVARLYNTDTPAVVRGWFGEGGRALAVQFVREDGTITSFEGPLVALGEADTDGSFVAFRQRALPPGVLSLAYNPTGAPHFATLEMTPEGGVRLMLYRRGKKPRELWRSWVRGWHLSWTTPAYILLVSNTMPQEVGVALEVGAADGVARPLAYGRSFNATLSPSGRYLLISAQNEQGEVRLSLINLEVGTSTPIPLATLAEKCGWGTDPSQGEFAVCGVHRAGVVVPANIISWYQGGGYFDDVLVRIWARSGTYETLADPLTLTQTRIDVASLTVAPGGSAVLLLDKRSLTPWLLELPPTSSTSPPDASHSDAR